MAALRLLRPMSLGLTASACVLGAPFLVRPQALRALHCDDSTHAFSSPADWSYSRDARTPVVKDGKANPRIWRQVSSGSILGLIGGLAISLFSKPLALLIGLLVIGIQTLEYRGIHIVPYNSIQRYFKNVNLRSAIQDNVAFKLSFGAAFSLAAFAEFLSLLCLAKSGLHDHYVYT